MSNQRIPVDAKNKGLAFRVVKAVAIPALARGEFERLMTTLNAYDNDTAGLDALALDLGLTADATGRSLATTARTICAYFNEVINTDNFVRAADSKTGKQVLDELMARLDQG